MHDQLRYAKLRNKLAALYWDSGRAVVVVQQADVRPELVKFSDRAIDNWDNIIREADKQDKLIRLIEVALEPFPTNEILQDVLDFLKAGGKILETSPAEISELENLEPEEGEPPYQGLEFYDVGDAKRFVGREALTAEIVGRLTKFRFLAVIGASGSGKSSVVRAGVIPAIISGAPLVDGSLPPSGSARWSYKVFNPGVHPLDALGAKLYSDATLTQTRSFRDELLADPRSLALAIRALLERENKRHLLLVVDQLEEIFTQSCKEDERRSLIDALIACSSQDDALPVTVIVCLRADFYPQVGEHARLRGLVSDQQKYIGAMSRDELKRAILEPAANGNWKVELGLEEIILGDLGYETDALPLLSHALLKTWEHRRGRVMTLRSYHDSGGIRGAIAQTAQSVFESLQDQQSVARMIFMNLVELGDGTLDPRRMTGRVRAVSELMAGTPAPSNIEQVLGILTDERLITSTTMEPGNIPAVKVVHEALIREWPLVGEWLKQYGQGQIAREQLTKDAKKWDKLDRDRGALYRGVVLSGALEWAKTPTVAEDPIGKTEQEFLAASEEENFQETDRIRRLGQTKWLFPLLVLAVIWAAVGATATSIFSKLVTVFIIFGWTRGWAKGLLVAFSAILALALNHLLRRYVPVVAGLPGDSSTLFWIQSLIVAALAFFGYQTVDLLPRLQSRARSERLQDNMFGAILGAIGGYLIVGTLLFYFAQSNFQVLPNVVIAPQTGEATQAMLRLLSYMPPHVLGEPGIYFTVILSFIFVVVVFAI